MDKGRTIKPENIYSSVSSGHEKEFFETLVEKGMLRIERIVSCGHRSPENGWYDQNQNEWVLLLKGSAVITFSNNVVVRLEEGDYIHIPPHQQHRVSWTDPNRETYWLAVYY